MFDPLITYEWRELTDDGRLILPICSHLTGIYESEAEAYATVAQALDRGLLSSYDTVKLTLVQLVQPKETY